MLPLRVILAITVLSCVYSATCPQSNEKFCNNVVDCEGNQECFGDIDGYENETICCELNNTLCIATGVKNIYTNGSISFHKFHEDLHDSKTHYRDPITGALCEFPYTKNQVDNSNILPKDFSINGTKQLGQCTNHLDCGQGFFCGKTINAEEDNRRLYCYKTPVLYSMPLLVDPTNEIFETCESNNDCQNSFCVKKNETANNGYCIEAQICKNGSSIATYEHKAQVCSDVKQCKLGNHSLDKAETVECKLYASNGVSSRGICCLTIEKCSHGISTVPQLQCNSTLDCNLQLDQSPIRGKWDKWCDDKGYCCHDPEDLTTGVCPDQATLAFNELKCEESNSTDSNSLICPNNPDAKCRFNHCCPGLTVYDNGTTLSNGLYETNMPCNESDDVPNPFRYAYCNGSYLVVIGRLDKSGGEYKRDGGDIRCRRNQDCSAHGLAFCVRESATDLYCYRDPINSVNEEEALWHIIVITVVVAIILTFIGTLIFSYKKKILKCWRRIFPEKPIDERCKLAQAIKEAVEIRKIRRRFRAHFVSNCQYRRYEVGMPKRLPKDKLDELVHMGYEDFADKYDYSYTQSKKEWDKWTGDLMDNILTQELVAEKEKKAGTVFIPREVEITKEDIERGRKEQAEVSLKDVYFDEKEYCVYRIGSDIDNVELEPSTESLSSSDDDSDPKSKKDKKEKSTSKTTQESSKSRASAKSTKRTTTNDGAVTSSNSNKSKKQKADEVKEVVKNDKSGTVRKEIAQKSGTSNKSKSKKGAK